ncbi:MAG: 2-oxoacid:ferredoxin oxidoreductase subunit gamma [Actinobacteria bacterium]|nr:2-oxoacid:ferredoxin oxidoreductase subunit gamma [Actinomycetota bacterium]
MVDGTTPSPIGSDQAPTSTPSSAQWEGLLFGREYVEVRFGGSGGQGVILMGVILATAATLDHHRVVQTESYGPEARGGYSRSDVIISSEPVDYPELERAHLLVALSQLAASQYIGTLRNDGIFIYDLEKVVEPPVFKGITFAIPFTEMALEETGRTQTTNILALGAVTSITGLVSVESLRKAVTGRVPAGTEEINNRALIRGLGIDPAEWQNGGARAYGLPVDR